MPRKIIIAGEGGQGIQSVAKILAKTAEKAGKFSSYLPAFGVEQRGGVSLAFVQISGKPISYPRFDQADTILAFCNRSISAIKKYLNDSTLLIYDNSEIDDEHLSKIKDQAKNFIAIPARQIALKKSLGKSSNLIMLGSLVDQIKDISFSDFERGVANEFKAKINQNPKLKETTLQALKEGADFAANYDSSKQSFLAEKPKEIQQVFENEKIKWARFPKYCKGCGLCLAKCPVHALTFSEDLGFLGNPLPIIDLNKCIGCGKCQDICPDGAISIEKKN